MLKYMTSLVIFLLTSFLLSCQNPFSRPDAALDLQLQLPLLSSLGPAESASRFIAPETQALRLQLFLGKRNIVDQILPVTEEDRNQGRMTIGIPGLAAGPEYRLLVRGFDIEGELLVSGQRTFSLLASQVNFIRLGLLPPIYRIKPMGVNHLSGENLVIPGGFHYKFARVILSAGAQLIEVTESETSGAITLYDRFGVPLSSSQYEVSTAGLVTTINLNAPYGGRYYVLVQNPSPLSDHFATFNISDSNTEDLFPPITVDVSSFTFRDPSMRPLYIGLMPSPFNFQPDPPVILFTRPNAMGIAEFPSLVFSDFFPGLYDEFALFVFDDIAKEFTTLDTHFLYSTAGGDFSPSHRIGVFTANQIPNVPRYSSNPQELIYGAPQDFVGPSDLRYFDLHPSILVSPGDSLTITPQGLPHRGESEPNNSSGEAQSLALVNNGLLNRILGALIPTIDEMDWYSFTAPATGNYSLNVGTFGDYPGSIDLVSTYAWSLEVQASLSPTLVSPIISQLGTSQALQENLTLNSGDTVYIRLVQVGGVTVPYSIWMESL